MSRHLSTVLFLIALAVPSAALAAETQSAAPVMAGIAFGWLVSAGGLAKDPRLGALLAGLMGLGVSLYLGVEHAQTGPLACTISETFDCGAVIRSEHSAIAGIPIALFGSGFYAAAAVGGLLALMNPARYRSGGKLLLGGGVLAVLFSIFLAVVSMQLGKWCLFCISLYGVNALLLISGLLWSRSGGEAAEEDGALQAMFGTGAAVFVVALLAYGQLDTSGGPTLSAGASPEALAELFQAVDGPMTLDGTEPILGDPSAPYTVVEFADFECPYCGRVAPELKQLVKDNPDIRVLFKHYPLSPICNENVQRDMHENSCGAAQAAECARQQGRFWEMSTLMFKNQRYLSPSDRAFIAQQVGLDIPTFEACVANPRTETEVLTDIMHANQLGINSTPSLYLLGLKGEEWVHMRGSPADIGVLVEAHRQGVELPPTPAARPL